MLRGQFGLCAASPRRRVERQTIIRAQRLTSSSVSAQKTWQRRDLAIALVSLVPQRQTHYRMYASTRSRLENADKNTEDGVEEPTEFKSIFNSATCSKMNNFVDHYKQRYPATLYAREACEYFGYKNECDFTSAVTRVFDQFGTVCFSASGAVIAATAGHDLFGCIALGATTALGGGTIRDVMLGGRPAFWTTDIAFFWLAIYGGLIGFFLAWADLDEWQPVKNSLFVFDNIALGTFAVVGTRWALRVIPGTPEMAVLAAFLTCGGGGVIRDIACQRRIRLFDPASESFAAVSVVSSSLFLCALFRGYGPLFCSALCLSSLCVLRTAKWYTKTTLPDVKRPQHAVTGNGQAVETATTTRKSTVLRGLDELKKSN